ncbi:MAG TPA: PIG-L family deacetylase [Acidimicrobiales bacterium]|nr:PIG-L family deacetylase [Acidimicrobiales bacterium]
MAMSEARRRVESALVPVKLPIAAWIGESMSRRGTDVTASTGRRSCLVLAPHPDDETLGCGATVMRKLDAGSAVQVVVISDGATWPPWRPREENIAVRDAELRASCRVLGLPEEAVTHLAFPETQLDSAGDALVDAVADAVRSHGPDEVFVTSEADPHSDHAALARATRRALTGGGVRLLAYPVWQWERPRSWARTVAAASAAETVSSAGYLERKRTAVEVFHSQMSEAAGGESTEGLRPAFLRHFLSGREMFFPVPL